MLCMWYLYLFCSKSLDNHSFTIIHVLFHRLLTCWFISSYFKKIQFLKLYLIFDNYSHPLKVIHLFSPLRFILLIWWSPAHRYELSVGLIVITGPSSVAVHHLANFCLSLVSWQFDIVTLKDSSYHLVSESQIVILAPARYQYKRYHKYCRTTEPSRKAAERNIFGAAAVGL